MYYLGIDPGVRKLGYAIIDKDLEIIDSGILLSEKISPQRGDYYIRIRDIAKFFEEVLENYRIRAIVLEKLFFSKFNQSNAEYVYGIRAVLIDMMIKNNIKIKEYAPVELKKSITGNGRASKELVVSFIQKIYGLEESPKYHDAADALGLAYLARRMFP